MIEFSKGSVEGYEKYLRKFRKAKNNDTLVESTIERYSFFINKNLEELIVQKSVDNLLSLMNEKIKEQGGTIIYASFWHYLQYLGYDDERILKQLITSKKGNSALRSKRFLQSKVLSRGELRRLYNETTDEQMKLIISILYDTACRRQELMGIKFSDIEFRNSKSEDIKRGIYASVGILGKGRKAREVYLGRTSVKLIHQQTGGKFQMGDYLLKFYKNDKQSLEFKDQEHELYKRLVKHCQTILKRHIHPHCFRHTRLTHMADLGADILDIAAYAGHESPITTQIYVQISTYRGKQAFSKYTKDIIDDTPL